MRSGVFESQYTLRLTTSEPRASVSSRKYVEDMPGGTRGRSTVRTPWPGSRGTATVRATARPPSIRRNSTRACSPRWGAFVRFDTRIEPSEYAYMMWTDSFAFFAPK